MKYSRRSLATRKGWCTRKGHVWGKEVPFMFGGVKHHRKTCLRCHRVWEDVDFPSAMRVVFQSPKIKELLERPFRDENPVLERMKRLGNRKHGK